MTESTADRLAEIRDWVTFVRSSNSKIVAAARYVADIEFLLDRVDGSR